MLIILGDTELRQCQLGGSHWVVVKSTGWYGHLGEKQPTDPTRSHRQFMAIGIVLGGLHRSITPPQRECSSGSC
ncbi:uncharacterized protein YALI1_F20831g [Yarrowia lipolytica]|uniref:Uncharacterized protein n=1 Tax=Yarrowia lipolytica TaxID=4952 RepID=A0A1D8NNM4_YARLL|nr:hypothetical protein YALI1_F20831g [Yarrowia lipolytica]